HNRGAVQLLNTFNDGGPALTTDLRAHTVKFRDMHETVRENFISDDADTRNNRHKRGILRLQVRRKTWMWISGHRNRFKRSSRLNSHEISSLFNLNTDLV